jgi:tRNA uridine 5-carboxymethylaminomethyl modification enzyme
MFTSRAEFRLHLRIDNADRRLTPYGRRVGLIGDSAWADYLAKQERMKAMHNLLERTRVNSDLAEKLKHDDAGLAVLESVGRSSNGQTLAQILKRPEVGVELLAPVLRVLMPAFFERGEASSSQPPAVSEENSVVIPSEAEGSGVSTATNPLSTTHYPLATDVRLSAEIRNELKSIETEIKYAGYLDQQTKSIERLKKAEQRTIPDWFDYGKVSGLSREMNEKLSRVRPRTLGQASRIPGVTPAAVSLINVYIEIQARQQARATQTA